MWWDADKILKQLWRFMWPISVILPFSRGYDKLNGKDKYWRKKHFHLWEWERIQFSWVPPGRSLILSTHLICLSSRFFLVRPWDHEANCYSLCNNEMVFFLQYPSCAGFCCEFRIRLRIVVVVRMDTDRQKTDNCCPIVFELEREECDWKEKTKILIGKCQRAISGKNSNWCEIQHEL